MLLALQILLQLAFGPTIPILWAMMADVADYSEWKTGRRSTALAFASIIFGLKLGFGVGGWLNGELLEYFGYSRPAPYPPSAHARHRHDDQRLSGGGLVDRRRVLFSYRLDDRLVKQIEQTLSARRNELDQLSTRRVSCPLMCHYQCCKSPSVLILCAMLRRSALVALPGPLEVTCPVRLSYDNR